MKKQYFVAVVVSLVLAAFLVPTTAMAADQIIKSTGDQAYANYSSTVGCIDTSVWVSAYEQAWASPPPKGESTAISEVYMQFDSRNRCTPDEWRYGYVSAPLAPSDFVVTQGSATLNAIVTLPIYDQSGGVVTEDVLINLSWSATGPASRNVFTSKISSPHCKISSRASGTNYPASVTGSISDGTTDFASGLSGAGIGSFKSASTTIGCGL